MSLDWLDWILLFSVLSRLTSPVQCQAADGCGKRFVTELSSRRWIPVISFENIIELFQHRNAQTVNSRISMFAAIPQIAHVNSLQHPGFPGSIADVLAREVRAFLSAKTSDVFSIAESVRSRLFAFCDGRKIANWLRRDMAMLWPLAQQDHARNRFLSSISHIDIMRAGNKKIGKLRANDRVDRAAIARIVQVWQNT